MRRATALVLCALLLPAPVLAQGDGPDAGGDWPPWFDTDLPVRVPLTISPGPNYPGAWDGPRLVTHELDVTQALIDGGWPTDAATGLPQRFTVDPDSVRVVRSNENLEPLDALVWDGPLLSEPGAHPSGHRVLTVAFLAPEGHDEFLVYMDRTEDSDHEPLTPDPAVSQRILQLLAGPGSGHDLYAVVEGRVNLVVGSAWSTTLTAERLTSQGWSSIDCNGQSISATPSSWARCPLSTDGPTPVRISADRPIVAYSWSQKESGTQRGEQRFLPLAGGHGGQAGTSVVVPAPRSNTQVKVMAVAPCDGGCQGSMDGQTFQVPLDTPVTRQISRPSLLTANGPVVAWVPGFGPSPMPVHPSPNGTTSGMSITQFEASENADWGRNSISVVGQRGARLLAFSDQGATLPTKRLTLGSTVRAEHDVGAAFWQDPKGDSPTGYTVKTLDGGPVAWPYVWDDPSPSGRSAAVQLAPTASGAVGWIGPDDGAEVRLTGITIGGRSNIRFGVNGDELDVQNGLSEARRFGEGPDDVAPGGAIVEAWTTGAPRLVAAFAFLGDGDMAPATFAGHLRPMKVTEDQAQIIGPLFDLGLDPESAIVAPGEVKTFDLLGKGHIRDANGTISPLEINLNVNATTDARTAPPLDVEIEETRVRLPIGESAKLTTVTITVPDQVTTGSKPVYDVVVTGEPVGGGDQIEARSSIQVVSERKISLTFVDGSSHKDLSTENGEARADLLLQNQGTDTERISLSVTAPDGLGWDLALLDGDSGAPAPEVVILEPDQSLPLELVVSASGEDTRIARVTVSAQSLVDTAISSEATARIAHGVAMDLLAEVRPDLVSLPRGGTTTVNLTLDNQGSPVNVQVFPDEVDHLVVEADRDSVNLGKPGTGASNATIPLNVTLGSQAPLGGVLVSTIRLETRVGELEPIEQLFSLRVRVVPDHGLTSASALEVLPGLRQPVVLTVEATGDTDENATLDLLEVPAGWEVEAPERLEVPVNATAPVRLNITTPAQTEAGTETLRLLARPSDGSEPIPIAARVTITSSPAYEITLPDQPMTAAVGATEAFTIRVENRGNQGGDLTLEAVGDGLEISLAPTSLALSPGGSEEVQVQLTPTQTGELVARFTADPGGLGELPVRSGDVSLSIERVSEDPSPPRQGDPYRVVVRVSNGGGVPARDVVVALSGDGERLTTERIGRLAPQAAATISLATGELPTVQGLQVEVDPDDHYSQDPTGDDIVSLSSEETPMPGTILALLLSIAVAIVARRT